MSALTSPKGPLPARVYWFRRLVLLAVVFLLVFGTGRLLGGSSDGSDPDSQATTAGAEVDPGASEATGEAAPGEGGEGTTEQAAPGAETDGAQPGTHDGGKKRKKQKPTPPPLPTPTGDCTGEDVVVTPVVGDGRPDGQVEMSLVLRTRSTPACTWQVSAETVAIKISSGKDDYWFSSHCPRAVPTQDVVVYQETDVSVPFVWSGRRSDEECSKLTAWAMPGYYHVKAAAYAGEPTEVQFKRGPVEVTVTKAAKPKKAKGKNKKTEKQKAKQREQKKKRRGQQSPEPSGAVEPTPTP